MKGLGASAAMNKHNPRTLCSWHEAGHCCVAMLCGIRVERVQLIDPWAAGRQAVTTYARGGCPHPHVWSDLAVIIAGPLCEALYADRDLLEVLNVGKAYLSSDLNKARREADRLYRLRLYKSVDHALLVATNRARSMLLDVWDPFVVKTASQLFNTGRID
jgi:hypothetical protein